MIVELPYQVSADLSALLLMSMHLMPSFESTYTCVSLSFFCTQLSSIGVFGTEAQDGVHAHGLFGQTFHVSSKLMSDQ